MFNTDGPTRWSLGALLPSTAGVESEAILANLQQAVEALESWRELLSPDISATDFVSLLSLVERDAHALVSEGRTVDQLSEQYLENLREQFGDSVVLGDGFRWEWITIPHFYGTPFYCYANSFGQLLVLALYPQYRAEGEAFVPKYLRILGYGGSASPHQVLAQVGIDISSADFWQSGFDSITDMIRELESLS